MILAEHKIEDLEMVKHETLGFVLSTKKVSSRYGVTSHTIKNHLREHSDELIEGRHWVLFEIQTNGGKQKAVHWTLEGMHLLGFFIKSPKAKAFRMVVSEFLQEIDKGNIGLVTKEQMNAMIRGYKSALAKKDKLIAELKAEQKLLPAPAPKGRVMGRFEMTAVLDVMSSGEQLLESAEKLRAMFDKLYAGADVYDVRKGM